jgi:hypothetical protein
MGEDIAAGCGARFHRHGLGAVLRAGLLPTAGAKRTRSNRPGAFTSGRLPDNGARAPGRKSPWERFYLLE